MLSRLLQMAGADVVMNIIIAGIATETRPKEVNTGVISNTNILPCII